MRLILPLVFALTLSAAARAGPTANPLPNQTETHWRHLLERIEVGMSRKRVEQILGTTKYTDTNAPPDLVRRSPTGAHTALYPLDDHWCAAIPFDFHGFDPDPKRNPYTLLSLPTHRVLAPPQLLVRDPALHGRLP